jgi:hypothetical protein
VIETAPAATPVNHPVVAPIVATDELPEIHVPPVVVFVRSTLSPSHTEPAPEMPAGSGLVVKMTSDLHPVDVKI